VERATGTDSDGGRSFWISRCCGGPFWKNELCFEWPGRRDRPTYTERQTMTFANHYSLPSRLQGAHV
jgi:hypothetical protein